MRKEERLFAAFSGVDEELLERSERKKSGGRRWICRLDTYDAAVEPTRDGIKL